MDVIFEDVRFSVKTGRSQWKVLLNGISGAAKAGELLAVMGPSGGGKTTLLNILAGQVRSSDGVEDKVSYGGKPYGKEVRRDIAFVTQQDLMFGNLTVMETLLFTANLRLPTKLSKEEKKERVRDVLSDLKLVNVEDTMIGDGLYHKGVSGGERKRVAIGNEVLTDPNIIFLDEPTSGLDASTALKIVKYLKTLAANGKTVIMSIHQPSSEVFNMFDRLLLLRDGQTVYHGDRSRAVSWFAGAGFECPFGYNPADYFMALISDIDDEEGPKPEEVLQKIESCYGSDGVPSISITWEPSEDNEDVRDEEKEVEKRKRERKYPVGWWTQFATLVWRSTKQRRGSIIESVSAMKYLVTTALFCMLWFQSEPVESQLLDRIGILYFSTVFWALASVLQTTTTFAAERDIIRKERGSSSYHLSAYFFAKSLVDIPYDLIYPVIFGFTVYWITGLNKIFWRFVMFMLVLLSHTICAFSVGLVASTAAMHVKKSMVIAAVFTMASVLLGGFYVNTNNLGKLASVLQYGSFLRYSYSALILNETNGSSYECDVEAPGTEFQVYGCPIEQSAILLSYPAVPIGVWGNLMVVWCFTIIFRTLAFLFLKGRKVSNVRK